jgi:hypothetical protein
MVEERYREEEREPILPWWEEPRMTNAYKVPQRRQAQAEHPASWQAQLWSGASLSLCALSLFVFVSCVVLPPWLTGVIQGIGLCVVLMSIILCGMALGQREKERR